MPDDYIAWLPPAVTAGLRLCRERRFDIIYASGWPVTSLMVAALVSRGAGVPWVGELRDPWAGNHYVQGPAYQPMLDQALERIVLNGAAGLVGASEGIATVLRERFAKPVATVYTGYMRPDTRTEVGAPKTAPLVVAHTGQLYDGKRDATPVFQAVARLGGDAAGIRLVFAGPDSRRLTSLAASFGLRSAVTVYPQLPRDEALDLQRRADISLALLWNTPEEAILVAGKVFEYIALRKPVLMVGAPERSEAARLVSERHLGRATNDVEEIAASSCAPGETRRCTAEPCRQSRLADTTGLSSREQAGELAAFLGSVTRRP